MAKSLKDILAKIRDNLYTAYTGKDEALDQSIKPYFRPASFFALGIAHGYANYFLQQKGATLLNQVLSNPSRNGSLQLILCICSFQLLKQGVDHIINVHQQNTENVLDKSSITIAKGKMGAICDALGMNYLSSIAASLWNINTTGYTVGSFLAGQYQVVEAISIANPYTRNAAIFIQLSSSLYQGISYYLDEQRQGKEILLREIETQIRILQSKASNPDWVSINDGLIKKQLDAFIKLKKEAQDALSLSTIFSLISKTAASAFHLFTSLSILETLERSDIQYSKTIINIQQFVSGIYLDTTNNTNKTYDPMPYINIKAASKAYDDVQPEQKDASNGTSVTFTKPVGKRSKRHYFDYSYDYAQQSVLLTGENGKGKSVILRTLGGSPIYKTTKSEFSTTYLYGKRLKQEDIVYIMQGDLKPLLSITVHQNLAPPAGVVGFYINAIKSKLFKKEETNISPDNIAGITPFDIFTAFLTEEQKEDNKQEITTECIRLIQAFKLEVTVPFKQYQDSGKSMPDIHQCIEIPAGSGGEQQKIKFIMMAVSALYGSKKLILVDELFNHLDPKSCKAIEAEFKALMQKTDKVKYISTDHEAYLRKELYHSSQTIV